MKNHLTPILSQGEGVAKQKLCIDHSMMKPA